MANLSLGVGWNSGSWFAVAFGPGGFDHAAPFDEISGLWHRYEERAARVLVGVPIGLVDDEEGRQCDSLARETLGPRSGSVFTPPTREAARRRRYSAASRVNERNAGRGLSEQAFGVSDGVAAVDKLLRNVPEARAVFAESHPEVCFRAFAGESLDHPRKKAGGYAERMQTLAEFDADAPRVVQAAAEAAGDADVAVDDVLDTVALAYTARPGPGKLRSLPPDPPTDTEGLPTRIVYRASAPLTE